ncbi:MAG: NAD-dependent epimerase/dehydratase family protein [Actinomycetota bacterium]|nr:NAD-dependent epimerase/dehydratase family protein [Actinomycetota bacterium]
MRAFVTGGTGFIGRHLVSRLRARGDDVVALVRSPARAETLRELGCELVTGDLDDAAVMQEAMEGCDAAFHGAAVYKIGVTEDECRDMHRTNVDGTATVFEASAAAGVARVVYVSTVNCFGDTSGRVLDEEDARPSGRFLSCYDATKFGAHEIAAQHIAGGAPIVVVQPGSVYGPGDHSQVGRMIADTVKGRTKLMLFPELGLTLVHVEDVADGIVAAHDKGRTGQSYVLGGHIGTMGELVRRVAELSGRKPPKHSLPTSVVRASLPLAPLISRAMGLPSNLRELVTASDGVTYWARDDKARLELGYAPRDLDTGLRQTLQDR